MIQEIWQERSKKLFIGGIMKLFLHIIGLSVLVVGSASAQRPGSISYGGSPSNGSNSTTRHFGRGQYQPTTNPNPQTSSTDAESIPHVSPQIQSLGHAASVTIFRTDNGEITPNDEHCAQLQLIELLHAKPAYENEAGAVNITLELMSEVPAWSATSTDIRLSLGANCKIVSSGKIAKQYGYTEKLGPKPSDSLDDLIADIIQR